MRQVSQHSTERLHALDGLRAVMMMLGLVIHTFLTYGTIPYGDAWSLKDPNTTTLFADLVVLYIHVFRMPIFFIIAGFFGALLYLRRGPKGMLQNRFQRIAIPMGVSLIFLYPLVIGSFTFTNVAFASSVSNGFSVIKGMLSSSDLYFTNSTFHLWFIYYLLYYYVFSLIIAAIFKVIPENITKGVMAAFKRIVAHPLLRILILGSITIFLLLPMGGTLRTSTAFQPDFEVLFAYMLFFGFGWLLYLERGLLSSFNTLAWTQTILATLIIFLTPVILMPIFSTPDGILNDAMILSIVGGFTVWMLFFGFTGLFLRYLNHPSNIIRYAVDASYWVYIVHLPFIAFFPGLLAGTSLSVWAKIFIVLVSTAIIGFGSYYCFVRSTFIGKALNGRRYSRGLPVLAP